MTKKAWDFLYTLVCNQKLLVREVIRIYEIYLDVYFVENSMLDAAMLTLALIIMKRKIVPWRIALAAFFGGVGAVLVLFLGMRYGFLYILTVLVTDLVMLFVAARLKASELLMGIIYFHALAFIYTKLDACVARLGIASGFRLVTLTLLTCMIMLLSWYKGRKSRQKIYTVIINENGENVELKALYDTGNSLLEPISRRPVSIIEENETTKLWLEAKPQKYKVIPFRSIGEEHGVLEGTMVDELIISINDKQIIEKDAVVALYKGRLSRDGSFQMILNQGLL